MRTEFFLMAQFGKTVIPAEEVCRAFFPHLSVEKFLRKAGAGDIQLPIMRMDASQKTAKGVHLSDLALYLDNVRDAAKRELASITAI